MCLKSTETVVSWSSTIDKCPKCMEFIIIKGESDKSLKDSVDELIYLYRDHLERSCDNNYSHIKTLISFKIRTETVSRYSVKRINFVENKLYI